MADVFISFANEDSKFAQELHVALSKHQLSVWIYSGALERGEDYNEQTWAALDAARIVLVIWTSASRSSRWVRAEALHAWQKGKLIQILAEEDVEPPGVFIADQGFDLSGWHFDIDDIPFQKLVEYLTLKLGTSGAKRALPNTDNPASPSATAEKPPQEKFPYLGLPEVSKKFTDYYDQNTFFITRTGVAITLGVFIIFGVADIFVSLGGRTLTYFRLLVCLPFAFVFYLLSYLQTSKQHHQAFAMTFGIIGTLLSCVVMALAENEKGSPFSAATGAPTTSFMVVLAVAAVIPFRVANAFLFGLIVFLLHIYFIYSLPMSLRTGYSIVVFSAWLAVVAVAYFREMLLRRSFIDFEKSSKRIAELIQLVTELNGREPKTTVDRPPKPRATLGRLRH